jgi:signal transduction histidine kinase
VRARLIAALLGLTLVVLLVHDIPLSRYLRTVETDRIITALERDSFIIAGKSEEALESPTIASTTVMWDAVNAYSKRSGARVMVMDSRGIVVSASNGTATLGTSYASRPEVKLALTGSVARGTRYSTTLKHSLLYVAVPVLNGKRTFGVVRVTFSSSFVDATVNQRIQGITTVAGITLLLALIVAILLANSITRRLTNLQETTEDFAKGQHEVRAGTNEGAPEIRALATSFNSMAQQLTHLLSQQRAFAGDASHQLRTPLTALQLRLERASEMVETDPEGARTRIEAAMLEADRLQRLVEGLLALSRTENLESIALTEVDLVEIVNERVESWMPLASEHDVVFAVDLPSLALVKSQQGIIEQVLDNYIDNALEVAPPASTITLAISIDTHSTTLHVQDEGPGLPESDLPKAFNRFWRARSDIHGSGLGLAIFERLMHACNGSAQLVNRTPHGLDAQATFETA